MKLWPPLNCERGLSRIFEHGSIATMKDQINFLVSVAIKELGFEEADFTVEHPEDLSFGDYSTNIAMVLGKKIGRNPVELAGEIVSVLEKNKSKQINKINVAGPGFINFHLTSDFFNETLNDILSQGERYGENKILNGQKTIVEYTDPNPFKEFHIGHMMSNAIGESISRLIAFQGAEVKRACYSGDKGIHVARAVAYKLQTKVDWSTEKDVALSYAEGSKLYESDEEFKVFVTTVNKKIYEETDADVNEVYMFGRRITLEYFEKLYRVLGTKFDYYFFESTTGEFGKAIVRANTPKVFEESEGAIVYKGEIRDSKLHTRVFMNKEGLPTYEAKELGLAKVKYDTYPYDSSIVITGNEVNDYFRVLMNALSEIFPDLEKKTHHIGHGMMRTATGKLSSRSGEAPTAEWLIEDVKTRALEKINASNREIPDKPLLAEHIAVGAIKYSILKQALGRDIIFDMDTALSFDGDSGPYLQYTNARINSLLEKGREAGINPKLLSQEIPSDLEKFLYRFPEVVARSYNELAPHYVATFLIEVAGLFNAFYGKNIFVDENNLEVSGHRLAVARAVSQIMQNGLNLLGISAPERM